MLLDNGRRTTHTAPTASEAAAWARAAEMGRDAEREARRDRSAEQSIAIYLAAVEDYASKGLLTRTHIETLHRIVSRAPGSPTREPVGP